MKVEILLLTKCDYEDELRCWLDWHLNIIGFDHIMIFDNESRIDIPNIIKDYPENSIDYKLIKGWPNQYSLYTEYLKTTKYDWSLPLDDDEFLYISDEFSSSIHTLISQLSPIYSKNFDKFYIMWVNMFSPTFLQTRTSLYINSHTNFSYTACSYLSHSWPEDSGWGKTLIDNSTQHFFSNVYAHIPKSLYTKSDATILLLPKLETPNSLNSLPIIYHQHLKLHNSLNEIISSVFIAHFQFKSQNDWITKCTRGRVDIKSNILLSKKHIYGKLYSFPQSLFKPCTLLKDKWNEYISTKSRTSSNSTSNLTN